MNALLDKISKIGIVPVVVLDDAEKAEAAAGALREGGIDCAEVTFRTAAAEESIRRIRKAYPDMLTGAGTVLSCEQADRAVDAGAEFIVTPGYNPEVVDYCISKEIPVIPGCMDTHAIEMALSAGLDTVKFFPAEAAGGLAMIKALSGPYVNLKFLPTGGISEKNIAEYLAFPKIIACGGSWMIKPALVRENRFDEIARLTREAVRKMLDFEVIRMGILQENEEEAAGNAARFESLFAESFIELTGTSSGGTRGYIDVGTASVDRAVYYLGKQDVHFRMETAEYDGEKLKSICLEEEAGGFAVRLVQK
ncbi:MAG: bifunctional 4-hydroxy-2-oxoglutarate aldolase/2-dehydro-3-deoxy-phosphogluconate aldolase [Emergencia sp.]